MAVQVTFKEQATGRFQVEARRQEDKILLHEARLRTRSVAQLDRFAAACEEKEPGCYREVREQIERFACRNTARLDAKAGGGARLVMTLASHIPCEPVEWLWEGYIPCGAVTILDGDPGVGKSILLADLAARVTRGFSPPKALREAEAPVEPRMPKTVSAQSSDPGTRAKNEEGFEETRHVNSAAQQELTPPAMPEVRAAEETDDLRAGRGSRDFAHSAHTHFVSHSDFRVNAATRAVLATLPPLDEDGFAPDEPCPGTVWWFAGGENAAQTVVPRLLAAGAELGMVQVIEGRKEEWSEQEPLRFPRDLNLLWANRRQAPKLIVIDPLVSFCGTGSGTLHEATARKVLMELSRFAAETSAAVVVVRHLNRRVGAGALERGSAGPSLLAEARSGLLLTPHPERGDRRVLASTKSNLGPTPAALELAIGTRLPVDTPRNRRFARYPAAVVDWLGNADFTADELVRHKRAAAAPTLRRVEAWVSAKLNDGPRNADELVREARLDDVPVAILRRVRTTLGVVVTGANGDTTWRLPESGNAEVGVRKEMLREGTRHAPRDESEPWSRMGLTNRTQPRAGLCRAAHWDAPRDESAIRDYLESDHRCRPLAHHAASLGKSHRAGRDESPQQDEEGREARSTG